MSGTQKLCPRVRAFVVEDAQSLTNSHPNYCALVVDLRYASTLARVEYSKEKMDNNYIEHAKSLYNII